MEILIRLIQYLLLLIFALFFGVESDAPAMPPDSPQGETMRQAILVDNVETQIMESDPVQVTLVVTGSIQDGCEIPTMTQVEQLEDTIYVSIFRDVPTDIMCPMVIQPYEEEIQLGTLQPGSYTIHINDTIIQLDI